MGGRQSCDLRRRRDAVRELPDEGEQALRLLKLRKMTSFWDELEASVRERLATRVSTCSGVTVAGSTRKGAGLWKLRAES